MTFENRASRNKHQQSYFQQKKKKMVLNDLRNVNETTIYDSILKEHLKQDRGSRLPIEVDINKCAVKKAVFENFKRYNLSFLRAKLGTGSYKKWECYSIFSWNFHSIYRKGVQRRSWRWLPWCICLFNIPLNPGEVSRNSHQYLIFLDHRLTTRYAFNNFKDILS